MGSIKTPNLFRNRPIFGLDVGYGSLKVMQVNGRGRVKKPRLVGYGTMTFDSSALKKGVLVRPEVIAEALYDLFKHQLVGHITTRRVAITIPLYRSFSRIIDLPSLSAKEQEEAVRLELERYAPRPLSDLYISHALTRKGKKTSVIRAVAVPRDIVDSYLVLTRMAGLEAVHMETTMDATGRLFLHDSYSDVPGVIIDFGSMTADIGVFDKQTMITGTVPAGELVLTDNIRTGLGVTPAEAAIIKTKYGLGLSKKQDELVRAFTPTLQKLIKEIRRVIRYHEERYGSEKPIGQVIILGRGANMPGLSDYLTSSLRLPVRVQDPWDCLDYRRLQAPNIADKLTYATVSGLSLVNTEGIFA